MTLHYSVDSSVEILTKKAEMLLVNMNFPRPLLIRKGVDYVASFLKQPSQEKAPLLFKTMVEHKIITDGNYSPAIDDDFNEVGKSSLALYMLVTQTCNLSCSYCLAGSQSYRQTKAMSRETAFLTLERAASSLKTDGTLEIIFFGGEPLLNWKLVKECLFFVENTLQTLFKDIKFSFNITTNMTLLPDDFIDLAKKYKLSILVDVDGQEKQHDLARPFTDGSPTFGKITKNLAILSDEQIPFQMRATIFADNVINLNEIVQLHKDLGAVSSGLPILIPVNSDGETIDEKFFPDMELYAQGIKKVLDEDIYDVFSFFPPNVYAQRILKGGLVNSGCGITRGAVAVVTANGDAYPCIYLVGKEDFFLGNVARKETLTQAEFSTVFREKYLSILNVDNMDTCKSCKEKYLCGGGCPIRILGFINSEEKKVKRAKNYFFKASCATAKTCIQGSLWHYAEKIGLENYGKLPKGEKIN